MNFHSIIKIYYVVSLKRLHTDFLLYVSCSNYIVKITRIVMKVVIFTVLSLLRLRHITFRHDTKTLSIEAKQKHVREMMAAEYAIRK